MPSMWHAYFISLLYNFKAVLNLNSYKMVKTGLGSGVPFFVIHKHKFQFSLHKLNVFTTAKSLHPYNNENELSYAPKSFLLPSTTTHNVCSPHNFHHPTEIRRRMFIKLQKKTLTLIWKLLASSSLSLAMA